MVVEIYIVWETEDSGPGRERMERSGGSRQVVPRCEGDREVHAPRTTAATTQHHLCDLALFCMHHPLQPS